VVLRLALRWVSRGMYVLYDYPVRDVGALVVPYSRERFVQDS